MTVMPLGHRITAVRQHGAVIVVQGVHSKDKSQHNSNRTHTHTHAHTRTHSHSQPTRVPPSPYPNNTASLQAKQSRNQGGSMKRTLLAFQPFLYSFLCVCCVSSSCCWTENMAFHFAFLRPGFVKWVERTF